MSPGYEDALGPVVPLSRRIFWTPTRYYKTGIVFLLAELFVLADRARLLVDPDLATHRMRCVVELAGVP